MSNEESNQQGGPAPSESAGPELGPMGPARAPRVRTKAKSASPLKGAIVLGGVALVLGAVGVVTWVQSSKPQVREGARTAGVAQNVVNVGVSGDSDPTEAYLELLRQENEAQVEAASRGERRSVVPPLVGERVLPPEPEVSFDVPAPPAPRSGGSRNPQAEQRQVQQLVGAGQRVRAQWAALPSPGTAAGAPLVAPSAVQPAARGEAAGGLPGPEVPLYVVQSAVMEVGANSDYPAEVIMRLTSGPLTGARVLGEFRGSAQQGVNDHLQLRVRRVEWEGQVFATDGLALDPATRIPAIQGDVNRHFARNVLARGSAAFLLGYAGGVSSRAGGLTVGPGGQLVSTLRTSDILRGEAAREGAAIANDFRMRLPTVTVPAGTGVGIVFLEPLRTRSGSEMAMSDGRRPPTPSEDAVTLSDGTQLRFEDL